MAPGLFVDHKKGEVLELKQEFRKLSSKDGKRAKELVQKVIAYMTLGIDVSGLFTEMIMAGAQGDIVIKKLVYLYITNYALSQADLTLLAINTLQKDCRDEDPMVRGLALRCLCNLRVKQILEYIPQPIKDGLSDRSPYVRKTAVISCVKYFHLDKRNFLDSGMLATVENLVMDRDPQVAINAICALNEIKKDEGGMQVNKKVVLVLLQRMKEFNEWGQCVALDCVARYSPSEQQEMFDIMNFLDDKLRASNSAVVMATTKVFLRLTQDSPKIHSQVFKRLRSPLLTLISGNNIEVVFANLTHALVIAEHSPEIFQKDYKQFFCRFSDPAYVKKRKMDVLVEVATEDNYENILEELAESASDTDVSMVKQAISCISKIISKVEGAEEAGCATLLGLLDNDIPLVTAETVFAMKNLLRKFPGKAAVFIPEIRKNVLKIDDSDAKVSLVWCLGEYGEQIDDAPYIIEDMIEDYADEESPQVRLELLTATMKMFFKRPPEVQKMLGRLLAAAQDDLHTDVHDRAMLYYRLLATSVQHAAAIVGGASKTVEGIFLEDDNAELKDRIFDEFNTLSVIFRKPSEKFMKTQQNDSDEGEAEEEEDDVEEEEIRESGGVGAATTSGSSFLDADCEMTQADFQERWFSLPVSHKLNLRGDPSFLLEGMEPTLRSANIMCMASGHQDGGKKFFFYASSDNQDYFYFMEVTISAEGLVDIVVKGDDESLVPEFLKEVARVLQGKVFPA